MIGIMRTVHGTYAPVTESFGARVNFRYPTLAPRRNPTPERMGTTTILSNARAVIPSPPTKYADPLMPQSVDRSRRWREDCKRASWYGRRRRRNQSQAKALA